MRAIILPGNNNCSIASNWYPWLREQLEQLGMEVIAQDMPDPVVARRSVWVPFIKERVRDPQNTVLIGHSSGAVAIMRYLEEGSCGLAVLVGGNHTDLGDELERASGYYDEPWRWATMKQNAGRIVIFASADDPYIDVSEPRHMANQLDARYREFSDRGHFDEQRFPELVVEVRDFLQD